MPCPTCTKRARAQFFHRVAQRLGEEATTSAIAVAYFAGIRLTPAETRVSWDASTETLTLTSRTAPVVLAVKKGSKIPVLTFNGKDHVIRNPEDAGFILQGRTP